MDRSLHQGWSLLLAGHALVARQIPFGEKGGTCRTATEDSLSRKKWAISSLCENDGYIQSKQWDLNTYILRGIDDDAAAHNDDDEDDAKEFLLNFNPKMSNRRTG